MAEAGGEWLVRGKFSHGGLRYLRRTGHGAARSGVVRYLVRVPGFADSSCTFRVP